VVGPVTRSGERAQGIAQFMPYTARARGLLDPFDPVQALPHAASYLADLRRQFGSLGLAAAAYNAGPQRVQDWLDGKGGLPAETRNYVAAITGEDADSFAAARRGETTVPPPAAVEPAASCATVRAALRQGVSPYLTALEQRIRTGVAMPWGVQLSGGFSRGKALAAFARAERRHAALLAGKDTMILQTRMLSRGSRAFYQVRVGLPSRAASDSLCDRLRAAGGACLVLRNIRARGRG
jgi:soluble lytic murein transglycosylase-like protein